MINDTREVWRDFVGASGDNWNVRLGDLGPPDKVNDRMFHWLIHPGPPLTCYLAHYHAQADHAFLGFFHKHPGITAIHLIVSGSGTVFLGETKNLIRAGSVVHIGPGVPHCFLPTDGDHLTYYALNTPRPGFGAENWHLAPEAGTVDRLGDPQAFSEKYGTVEKFFTTISGSLYESSRWTNAFKGGFADSVDD